MLMNQIDVAMQKNILFAQYRKNWAEKAVRRFYGAFFEDYADKEVLEIGCGSGCGTAVLRKYFRYRGLTVLDLDLRLVEKAKANLCDASIRFEVGDACALRYEDESFDAIFEFGAIHHIGEWRTCLSELRRVLKSGGRMFFIDCPIEAFRTVVGRVVRTYTLHPYDEMFSEREFADYLEGLRLKFVIHEEYWPILYYFVIVVEK